MFVVSRIGRRHPKSIFSKRNSRKQTLKKANALYKVCLWFFNYYYCGALIGNILKKDKKKAGRGGGERGVGLVGQWKNKAKGSLAIPSQQSKLLQLVVFSFGKHIPARAISETFIWLHS